jgi:kelch-like protein 10
MEKMEICRAEPIGDAEPEKRISVCACNVLNELRETNQLTDAVIKTANATEFPVHRAILASASQYFLALFTNGMLADDKRAITIPGVEDDMMAAVIEYAYTRKTEITEENVIRLLPAADQLNMLGLVKQCAEFLIRQLSSENCIGIRAFARQFFCRQLDKAAHNYVMKNFVDISKNSSELLELDMARFIEIITDDHLNVKNEEIVFDAVIKWIKADPNNRKSAIVELLKGVRLGLLSTQYFVEKVKAHEYIKVRPPIPIFFLIFFTIIFRLLS